MQILRNLPWYLLFLGISAWSETTLGIGARISGGPDGGGYSYFDQADNCSYSFVDIAATGTLLVTGDDLENAVVLGGTAFELYGTDASILKVNTNGFLTTDLAGTNNDPSNDCPIPTAPSTGGGDRLMVLHDDLVTSVYHQYFFNPCPRPNDAGLATTACNILQWQGTYSAGGGNVNFQAVIYDDIDEIVYQYATVDQSGASSTTGLQNGSADTGLLYGCDNNGYVAANSAVCIFNASPAPICGGVDVLVDDKLFPPLSNFNCAATNSITTGSLGVSILRNAVVSFYAPTATFEGPFTVAKGGIFNFINDTPPPCPDPSADADNDRLPDCAETNTGIFVNVNNTGTDPNAADTDGDGIQDGDEVLGTLAGLNLPDMGTNPLRKNILLEYDWFDDNLDPFDCGSHSHRPTAASIAMIDMAFSNAPISNPDGTTGITSIHDYGQGGLFTGGNLILDPNGVIDGGVDDIEFNTHKTANFAGNRDDYFHYVLLPHHYDTSSGSSGQAELPGNDLIVSLQCYFDDASVSHTIMHELGHNLDLRHGGFENRNWKPNYNSVMNYKYQFPGVDSCSNANPAGDGVLNYSIGDRIPLDENALNEPLGTCGTLAWDWNEDGDNVDIGVSEDINCWFQNPHEYCDGTLNVLEDYDDWGNIYFGGLGDTDGMTRGKRSIEIISCDNPPPRF